MLYFHGIEYFAGAPQKYAYSLPLLKCLAEVVGLLPAEPNELEQHTKAVQKQISALFSSQAVHLKGAAKHQALLGLTLKSDLLKFYGQARSEKPFCQKLFTLLATLQAGQSPNLIWPTVRELFYAFHAGWDQSFAASFLPENFSTQALQLVKLSFLDALAIYPPANTKLIFPPKTFPHHQWLWLNPKAQDTTGEWLPAEELCQWAFLQADLWVNRPQAPPRQGLTHSSSPSNNTLSAGLEPSGHKSVVKQSPTLGKALAWPLLPVAPKKQKSLKLQHPGWKNPQLELFPLKPFEFFDVFQKDILKNTGLAGLLQFLAILRQLAEQPEATELWFDVDRHLALVRKKPSDTQRAWLTAEKIFAELSKLEIERTFTGPEGAEPVTSWQKTSKLFVILARVIWANGGKLPPTEPVYQPNLKFELKLDPYLCANLVENRYHLGAPYLFMEESLFSTSLTKEYSSLVFFYSYLCTRWLYDFPYAEGVCKVSVNECIQAASLKVTKSSKYRTYHKVLHLLRIMQDMGYLGEYKILGEAQKLADQLGIVLTAPAPVRASLQKFHYAVI